MALGKTIIAAMLAKLARTGMLIAAIGVAGCNDSSMKDFAPQANKPLPDKILADMRAKGMARTSSVMARIFKEEGKLEIWKAKTNGRYDLVATYDICKWSGKLGPKYTEGDRQAPEGFYTVRPAQMNPRSSYHLSFNIGFPNAYDRANGRTGQNLMVHGACSSSGCYSMTDQSVAQIYAFGRDAFQGGQREFQIEAFPFRMTAANMARYRNDPNYPFWKMLKQGYDAFEATKVPPKVDVCEKRYVFNVPTPDGQSLSPTGPCPPAANGAALTVAYAQPHKTLESAFTAADKAPSPSIQGLPEAKLVAAWSAARARGEKVSREPPSLTPASAETPGAPDIRPAPPVIQPSAVAAAPKSARPATAAPARTASVPLPKQNPAAAAQATPPAQSAAGETAQVAQNAEQPPAAAAAPASEQKKSLWQALGY